MSLVAISADRRTMFRRTATGLAAASVPYAGPTVVGVTNGRNGNPTLHGDTASGDVGLLIVGYSGANGTPDLDITVSGDWETQELWTPPADALHRLFGWWDDFGGSPAAPTLSGGTQTGNYEWCMIVVRGASTTAPIDDADVADTSSVDQARVALTSTGDDRLFLQVMSIRDATVPNVGVVSNGAYDATLLLDVANGTGADTAMAVAVLEQRLAGTPTAGQWDHSSQAGMRAGVAIKA